MEKEISKNIQTVLAILRDEVNGDILSALQKMTADYSMTWVYIGKNNQLFPCVDTNIKKEMEEVYPIKERVYDIKNIAEGDDVVIIELIESYRDPKTQKLFRSPLVLVLEMENGKIKTGRHYLDPRLSEKYLTEQKAEKAFKNHKGSKYIIK